ncbi:hypothetical protein EV386_3202 [Xylanimonas ulmi]|uniref:Uncharacterized protein n=1 Tax=Xylanimonas ulmi TaxID=228973 RepID=A0A4Q7M828_9MICO|nr:hypothetical protein EV386_3202 [Xylanibacterium ulmi]
MTEERGGVLLAVAAQARVTIPGALVTPERAARERASREGPARLHDPFVVRRRSRRVDAGRLRGVLGEEGRHLFSGDLVADNAALAHDPHVGLHAEVEFARDVLVVHRGRGDDDGSGGRGDDVAHPRGGDRRGEPGPSGPSTRMSAWKWTTPPPGLRRPRWRTSASGAVGPLPPRRAARRGRCADAGTRSSSWTGSPSEGDGPRRARARTSRPGRRSAARVKRGQRSRRTAARRRPGRSRRTATRSRCRCGTAAPPQAQPAAGRSSPREGEGGRCSTREGRGTSCRRRRSRRRRPGGA